VKPWDPGGVKMNSREKILAAVKKNQPSLQALPSTAAIDAIQFDRPLEKFKAVLEGIGGLLIADASLQQVGAYIRQQFTEGERYISTVPELEGIGAIDHNNKAHQLDDVEVAVVSGAFAVAENSAIWVTASSLKTRVLPFICQHLVIILHPQNIVHNMHEAYERIDADEYDYGVFIAGPSKTADIEQSLVLGAHGPKTLTVFLVS
jgi:L-lactate dehydrogenase complex protein LldG